MSEVLAEKEEKQVVIDDNIYKEFYNRYGVATANSLIVFYEQCRQFGDEFLRQWYDSRTYYRYRNILVRDGYLYFVRYDRKKGGSVHIPPPMG
jgi:hypothetical protein